ncbi:hypothetical protein, partial [Cronobacter turicensis]|uniref:hypothetical protein n=1 Tax=Cronobacter turicensis TaxID=413502 RepID=UPI0024C37794
NWDGKLIFSKCAMVSLRGAAGNGCSGRYLNIIRRRGYLVAQPSDKSNEAIRRKNFFIVCQRAHRHHAINTVQQMSPGQHKTVNYTPVRTSDKVAPLVFCLR